MAGQNQTAGKLVPSNIPIGLCFVEHPRGAPDFIDERRNFRAGSFISILGKAGVHQEAWSVICLREQVWA
jgi:hypothetical protein